MSHQPPECEHVWSAWTTAQATNDAGEPVFVFQKKCYTCGLVESEAGAIVEPR